VRQARNYLARLEQHAARDDGQGDLFSGALPADVAASTDPQAAAVLERLRALDPDALSPREALDALYALQRLAAE
jgi:DNA mismatch repair protein MutS